jgi:diadenosine tetraphosphatase ApaH/serine/threonine PP2A family protein phosphatase
MASAAVEWTRNVLKGRNMRFLSSLPEVIEEDGFFMVHGSPKKHLTEYVYPEAPNLDDYVRGIEKKTLVLGHTHVQFKEKIGEKLIFNPGSVGQPRDGDPRAGYAIYDTKSGELELKRVGYDVKRVADEIVKQRLPDQLALRLYAGW